MKDFIILTETEGILFTGDNILHVLATFMKYSSEKVIGICELNALNKANDISHLTAHIGLS